MSMILLVLVVGLFGSKNSVCAFEVNPVRCRRSISQPRNDLNRCAKRFTVLGMSNDARNRNLYTKTTTNSHSSINKELLILGTVPMAWGTFEPAVRLVYKYEPAMPPLVFSFAYYAVATSVLLIGSLYSSAVTRVSESTVDESLNEERDEISTKNRGGNSFLSLPLTTVGGIELGTYLFVGNAFQVIGLNTVPSDRAAFLLQLTTIFVPLLKSATTSTVIPLQTWLACLVALLGVAFIGLDGVADIDDSWLSTGGSYGMIDDVLRLFDHLPAFTLEDGYIILAAVFYTFHCVRLENYARSSASAIGLATAKATTEMFWSGFAIVACILSVFVPGFEKNNASGSTYGAGIIDMPRISGEKILSYGYDIQHHISSSSFDLLFSSSGWSSVILATFWVGAITVAYTIYAQSYGQSRVPAITANLIYSSQPIFTAIVAYLLLGESLGSNGYIGGILIGAAVLMVITAEAETQAPDAKAND